MRVQWVDLKQDPKGRAVIQMVLDASPDKLSNVCRDIRQGKPYDMSLKPFSGPKSIDQVGAIWGKIGELADALNASKDEIYNECLRRYGPSVAMRIPKEAVGDIESVFKMVDVKAEREDKTVFVMAYKGLSQMSTLEASKLLDGVLSECKEVGISAEVRHD